MRRISRRIAKPAGLSSEDNKAMHDYLSSISKKMAQIDALNEQIANETRQVQILMGRGSLLAVSEGDLVAEYVEPQSKSTSYINPKDVAELLDEEEFYQCVTVAQKNLSKFLATAEIDKIKQVTPGAKKEKEFRISRRK